MQHLVTNLGMFQRLGPLQTHEVDVVGGVNGTGHAVNAMSHGNPSTEDTPVLDVIDSAINGAMNVLSNASPESKT